MLRISRAAAYIKRLTGFGSFTVAEHFQRIYDENLFASEESRSGKGSSMTQTERLRMELPCLLAEAGVRVFLDAPCGDCHWIEKLDWNTIHYIGADVVPDLIALNRERFANRGMDFLLANLCADPLPRADLIFCRDCWVHLDHRQIHACLENFQRSGAEYLLTTTFPKLEKNRDLRAAIWRPLNLQAAPFNFPSPIALVEEGCSEAGNFADKSLGLWCLKDLAF